MAFPNLVVPLYPDVPIALGVPPVLRSPLFPPAALPALQFVDAIIGALAPPIWGIFGPFPIIGDSVVGIDFRKEYRISDYPIEDGGFESYDKVESPYDAKVQFTIGGTEGDRAEFLASVQAASASLELFTVVTPEVTYPNANVVHYDYRREARNGATLITVNVWVEEVRVTASAQFTNSKTASGTDPVNDGTVQAVQGTSSATAVL